MSDKQEPVAWQATDEFGRPSGFLSWRDDETRWPKNESVPLYLQPKPTLTDAERSAITEASEFYIGTRTGLALSGLLSRTGLDSRQTCDNATECRSHGVKLPERERLADHPEKPDSSTLTDAEREAVERAADALGGVDDWSPDESEKDDKAVATLRSLLGRMK